MTTWTNLDNPQPPPILAAQLEKKDIAVWVRMTPDHLKRLDRWCEAQGKTRGSPLSRSAAVRELVWRALQKEGQV